MKKLFILVILFYGSLFAKPTVQKAVFDCASKNMKFVSSRIWLIEQSAKEYAEKKIPYEFILTIHSGCTPIVEKGSDNKMIQKIQERLQTLSQSYNLKVEACAIAVDRFGYEKEDLLPFIYTVPNSITRVIGLQNSGYAFIPYH